jgi:hypothetical protein
MVRHSKDYKCPFVWGLEVALGFLFELGENCAYRIRGKRDLHEKFDSFSGGQLSSRQISDMMYELKRNKYIEIDESENERSIKLTNKAKIKIIEKIIKKEKNDSKYRFISFDIPERLHSRRDRFRGSIKRMGFRQIQQSLWVTDKNIGEMVEVAAREYGVEDYVAYIVSEKSNIDVHVKNILEIKIS